MKLITLSCTSLAIVVAVGLVSPMAFAVGKAGLWESTTTMDMGAAMPKIPPAQLEKMKQMGIKLPMVEPTITKYCVTPEMAARDTPPNDAENRGCRMTNMKKTGNTMSADMLCDGEFKGTGHFEATYNGDASYTSNIAMKGTTARSPAPIDMKINSSGKWLSADCGSIKPYTAQPAAKP